MKLRSILVPTDFSEGSKKALRSALAMAKDSGATITLLHVVEPVALPELAALPVLLENDKVAASAKASLRRMCEREGVPAARLDRVLVRTGSAFHEITEAARTLKADLIVIATRGHTGLKHVLLGSTAERVVRHAPCPVLVVR